MRLIEICGDGYITATAVIFVETFGQSKDRKGWISTRIRASNFGVSLHGLARHGD
jgi:hypothetical protein